ncbi:MAG: energy transducer TonB [Telluria sp.]
MNPATAGGAPYRVPPEPSRFPAIALAVVMHAVLLFFLWFGVQWQNNAPVAVEAEVWDLKTQQAAPPAPPPAPVVEPQPAPPPQKVEEPPAVKPPDIALEREKKRKEEELRQKQLAEQKEREQQELEKKLALEKQKQEKLKKAAEEKRLAQIREADLKRLTAQLGGAGPAEKSTGPKSDPGYIAALTAKIKANIIYTGARDLPGDPRAIYRIDQLPTGEIIGFKKIQSSGVPEYDRAVEEAIRSSSPLPKKKNGTVERTIEPIFRLKE